MKKVDYKMFNDSSFTDCSVCFAGWEKCSPGHSFGPAVRPTYIIHYIVEGEGKFFCGDQEYHLHTEDGFLIEPDILTFYQADFKSPWHYLWIGMKGEKVPEFLKRMGKSYQSPIFHCEDREEMMEILFKILKTDSSGIRQEFQRQSLLFAFLSQLSPKTMYTDSMVASRQLRENAYLVKAIEFIQNNFYNALQVKDVAEHLGINRSYLFTLFKKFIGHSPQEYIAYCKLSKACNLLDDTGYSMEKVAYSCGYDSQAVFTKAFKKHYGIPPSQYRKIRIQKPDLTKIGLMRYIKKTYQNR